MLNVRGCNVLNASITQPGECEDWVASVNVYGIRLLKRWVQYRAQAYAKKEKAHKHIHIHMSAHEQANTLSTYQ